MFQVYVKTNENNNIIAINSNIFIEDLTGWIQIDEGESLEYMHAQHNYLPKPLAGEYGTYRYSYVNNMVQEMDEIDFILAEQEAMVVNTTPSQLERIESQIAYLAMMTNNAEILEVV